MNNYESPTRPDDGLPVSEPSFVERNNIHPVVFALFTLFVVFVLYQLVAGTVTYILVGGSRITPENAYSVRVLTMAGQILFILAPTLLLARLLSRRRGDIFRWRIPSIQETFFASLGLLFLQQVFQIYLFFQDRIPLPREVRKLLDPVKEMMEEMFRGLVAADTIAELLMVLLVVAIVPAIVEELFFRGLIQTSFERVLTPIRAAVLSGIIFGLYHFNPFAVVPLIGLGCYFGFLRHRSRSILIAITVHFINNAIAVIVVYSKMDESLIIGAAKESTPDITIVLVQLFLFLMLFAASFLAYVKSTARQQEAQPRGLA